MGRDEESRECSGKLWTYEEAQEVRSVAGDGEPNTSIDDPPPWPEWLPAEGWRIAYRRLANGNLHIVYIPPGSTRFVWHKVNVLAFIAGVGHIIGSGDPCSAETTCDDVVVPASASSAAKVVETPLPKRRRQNNAPGEHPSPCSDEDKHAFEAVKASEPVGAAGKAENAESLSCCPFRLRRHGIASARAGTTPATKQLEPGGGAVAETLATLTSKASEDGHGAAADTASNGFSVGDFYSFLQCQLKLEVKTLMQHDVTLDDPTSLEMWPSYRCLMERNQGKNEKWVPYHTVLGIHEFFVVKHIHHADVACWTSFRRFVCMLIFRGTCKCELFTNVQLPLLRQEAFWEDAKANFDVGSAMHVALQKYRRAGNALQTTCFLMIPERIVKDDDDNLILNILLRSQRLIDLAAVLWPIVHDETTGRDQKFAAISKEIAKVKNFGETWVKMLTVCIDIAFPKLQLLTDRCEVGVGAAGPLRQILEAEGLLAPKEARNGAGKKKGTKGADEGSLAFVTVMQFYGLVSVRRQNVQLIQVTAKMAGSLDRAHAVAVGLCEAANDGADRLFLERRREELLRDLKLVVPALGLDVVADGARSKQLQVKDQTRDPKEALRKLLAVVNSSDAPSSERFWDVLAVVEAHARHYYQDLPLVVAQMRTPRGQLTAATLQVQLCEFRQFQNYWRRCRDFDSTREA